ncbi:MAG: hypothetical protein WBF17_17045 [Phycisphaerae bacterium]
MNIASKRAPGPGAAYVMGVFLMAVASARVGAGLAGTPKVDPGDATWHIGLVELWGKDNKGEGRNLDIYPVFEKGKWARAVATARRFNTSIHLIEKSTVRLDGDKVTGRLGILLTPDQWVPPDKQPIPVIAEIDGRLVPGDGETAKLVRGTYKAKIGGEEVRGDLVGGVGATETNWDDSSWSVRLNRVPAPDGQNQPVTEIVVGVAEGKVRRGRIGVSYRGPAPREYCFDPSALKYNGAEVTGTIRVPARAVEITADPKAVCDVEMTIYRVQGLVGGKGRFAIRLDGRPVGEPFMAYGRGTGKKGGGKTESDAPRPLWKYGLDNEAWWVPVKGFKAPAPGEHPRLWFRRSDVEPLRVKAGTPEGKAILTRLRRMLDGGNGETLPKDFNPTPPHNHNKSPRFAMGTTFTSWHCVGYALLHTVTGERKYDDLARESLELMFAGKMDIDNRYGWKTPGTGFRPGPILAGVGLTYDMCYDAWPDDFRRKVALSIQDYAQPTASSGGGKTVTLKYLSGRTGYPPGSNHYGAHVAAGTGVLAILGDPGVDDGRMKVRLAEFERDLVHSLAYGFGDGGFFSEGHHPGRVSSNLGILPFMMALRTAAGRDYIAARANSQWITLRWVLETVSGKGGAYFPHRGVYGGDDFDMDGMSHDGEFAYGFGSIPDEHRPALLWLYENSVKPHRDTWGAATYPNRAVAAFVNWPAGAKATNPEEVCPRAVADTVHGYFVNRNRWKDAEDIVITHLLATGPEGYYRVKDAGTIHVWGLGVRASWKTGMRNALPTFWQAQKDGSSVLTVADGSSLAVDFSGASGAPAMLVGTGPAFAKTSHRPPRTKGAATTRLTEVEAGGRKFALLTLQTGEAPSPAAAAQTVTIGKQTVAFDGEKIVLKPR